MKLSKPLATVLSFVMVVALGIIDYLTGYEISFSIFYLVPLWLAAWFAGRLAGVIISVVSAVTWLICDLAAGHPYSHYLIPFWNATMRLGFFLLFVFTLSKVQRLLDTEQALSRTDPLTGVANSRHFHELAGVELNRAARSKQPLSIAFIDIDNFKHVNDTQGHSAGDRILKLTGEVFQKGIRSTDIIARVGGDEFVILMPETSSEQARLLIERILPPFAESIEVRYPVSFSIGVVTCNISGNVPHQVDKLIKEADELMYEVKGSGKDNIKYKTCDLSE